MTDVSPEARYAFEFYKKKGLSDIAAAGFVGNLMGESSMNPRAIRENDAGPGLHSRGYGQWNRERWEGLQKLAAERGTSWDDVDTQLEWGWQEMNTTEAGTLARLRSATNIDEATDAGIMYERPQGSEKGPRFGHNWSGRNANARALLGMEPGSVADYTPTSRPATTPYNPTSVNTSGQGPAAVNAAMFPDLYNEQVPASTLPGLYKAAPTFMEIMDAVPKEAPYLHVYQSLVSDAERPDQQWLESRTIDTFKSAPGYQGLSPEWQNWVVENSVSPSSLDQKIGWAMDQMNASDVVDRSGWTGTGLRLLSGIGDPSMWALEIGTGGVGATASIGSTLLRAGAEAGRQGAIAAVLDAPRFETTPNYSVRDLALDSSIAMAAGGVFGAIFKNSSAIDPTLSQDTQAAFSAHAMRTGDDVAAAMRGGRSVGAAEAGPIPYAYTAEGIARAQASTALSSSVTDSVRIDAHAAGIRTGNSAVVETMNKLMPDPVGAGGLVPQGKVDAFTWMDKEVKGATVEFESAVEDAFQVYLEEQSGGRGAKLFGLSAKLEKRAEFNRAITEAVETPNKADLPPSLKSASEAFSRHNARVLKATQEAGYKPAQGFEHSDSYSPRNKNRENFRAMVDKFGYEGLVEGTAEAMAKESPDAMQTYASRFAHREARLEAGWAVDDARQDVINAVKDDLGEDLGDLATKAKGDVASINAEKASKLDELQRFHDETIQAATDHAHTLRKQAKALRSTADEGHGVDRGARIQAEAQELLQLADETVKAAKTAAAKAKADVRKYAAGRRTNVLTEQKGKIKDAKRLAGSEAASRLDEIEPKLSSIWDTAYRNAADAAFGQATKLWFKRYARKYVDTLNRVSEKSDGLFGRGMAGEDREALRQYLIEGGMDADEAEIAVMMMKGTDSKGVRSTRHRAPLNADLEVQLPQGVFRAKDMFERDAFKNADQYRRSMLSAAALSRAGFQSEAAARTHIADITNVEKLRRAGVTVLPGEESNYLKARQVMDKYVDHIIGKPEGDPDAFVKLKSAGRTFRNLAFAQFMTMNGISQIGDLPKIIARNGVAAAFSQFDLGDIFRVFRSGSAGRAGNELAEGLEILTGQGSNTARTRVFTAYEGLDKYYGESFTEKLFGRAEHITKGMAQATNLIGMSAPVTDFLTRWSTRSTLQAFVNHAQGRKLISPKLLNDMGFTPDMATSLNAMIKDGAIELADTGVVKKLHLDKLDTKWSREIDDLMSNVTREAKVQVLEASPAHLPLLMQNETGRLFGQFKTFMVASYASNSLRGIRMHDASAATSLVMSSLLGAATYALTAHMRAFGKPEKEREAYLDKYLYSRKAITAAFLGRSGDLAVLPFVVDSMLSPLSTLTGTDLRVFDGSRTSGLGNDLVGGLPAFQMVKRLGDLTFGSLVDAMRSDQQVTSREAMDRASTVVPWLKTYGLLNATQAILSHLPDREPSDKTFNRD